MKIATVISSWEPRFVRAARSSGTLHVAARCTSARELAPHLSGVDAVIVGADVPWLDGAAVRFWHRAGVSVIGIGANRGEREILDKLGCDAVFDPGVDPIRVLGVSPQPERAGGMLVWVGGPRGAPGRTEVALGLAWAASGEGRVLLVEADGDAPSLGLRLGMPPTSGLEPVEVGPIDTVIPPPAWGPLAEHVLDRVFLAAACNYDLVVVDAGTEPMPGNGVVVVQPTAVGLVRAARLLSRHRRPPGLVANRVASQDELRAVRAATGLEPDAVIGVLEPPTGRPHPQAVAALLPLAQSLARPGQIRAAL